MHVLSLLITRRKHSRQLPDSRKIYRKLKHCLMHGSRMNQHVLVYLSLRDREWMTSAAHEDRKVFVDILNRCCILIGIRESLSIRSIRSSVRYEWPPDQRAWQQIFVSVCMSGIEDSAVCNWWLYWLVRSLIVVADLVWPCPRFHGAL